MMKTRPVRLLAALALLCMPMVVYSQSQAPSTQPPATQPQATQPSDQRQAVSDEEIRLMRSDIRSQKKHIIAQNLGLTEKEAQQFWPVYDRYTADLIKVNDTKYKLIQDYMQNRNQLTDSQANTWAEQWLQVDQETVALRQKYLPDFRRVLPGRKAALYEQLDRRTQLIIDLQLASQIPLLEPR
jgi:hypothetical protein